MVLAMVQADQGDTQGDAPFDDEALSFKQRYVLLEKSGTNSLGEIYHAADSANGGNPVRVVHLDPEVSAHPLKRRGLLGQLARLGQNPHGNLLAPLDSVTMDSGIWLAFPPLAGWSLQELLGGWGPLAPQEVALILPGLAAVADHAMAHGLSGVDFDLSRVFLALADDTTHPDFPRLAGMRFTQWPDCYVKVEALSVEEDSSQETKLVPRLAQFVRQLLGGVDIGDQGDALLRRGLSAPHSFASAESFAQQFATATAAAAVPLPAVMASDSIPMAIPAATTQPLIPAPTMLRRVNQDYDRTPSIPRKGNSKGRVAMALTAVVLLGPVYYYAAYRIVVSSGAKSALAIAGTAAKPKSVTIPAPNKSYPPPYEELKLSPGREAFLLPGPSPDASEWPALAQGGDAYIQALLGDRLVFGGTHSTATQVAEGKDWIAKSAAQKHPLGMFLDAEQKWMDLKRPAGIDIPAALQDRFHKAFDNGFETGAAGGAGAWHAALGRAYWYGLGARINERVAHQELELCIEDHHAYGIYVLGEIEEKGASSEPQRDLAAVSYNVAARSGWQPAWAAAARLFGLGYTEVALTDKSFGWAEEAAKKGDPGGQVAAGLVEELGLDTPVNPGRALGWYQLASKNGSAEAKGLLARLYLQGVGESPGDAEILHMLEEAQDKGSYATSSDLGRMYETGRGGPADLSRALATYAAGARNGDIRSMCLLGDHAERGAGMDADPGLAVELFEHAAMAGSKQGKLRAGLARIHGRGATKDPEWGASTIRAAAEEESPEAALEWGRCQELGTGTRVDAKGALEWYEKAAAAGIAEADFRAGVMFEEGKGMPKNPKEAIRRYQAAAKKNFAPAMVNLGLMFARGEGGELDEKRAVELYSKAADQGDIDATVLLGMMTEFGRGTPKDLAAARTIYHKAAAKGDPDAIKRLKFLNS